MKKLFYSLFFLLPLVTVAQTDSPAQSKEVFIFHNKIKAKPGELYVDNKKYDPNKTFLDPTNFDDVKVVKADADKANKKAKGATFITRKSKPKLFTLNAMVQQIKQGNEKIKDAKTVNVVLNGIHIEDTEGYMIEKSAIENIEIIMPDKKGVNRDGTTPTIVITTKTKNRRK